MTQYDLSVIVTAHSETVVAGPTMKSAEAAIAAAVATGLTVERLIVLDTPKPECRVFFSQPEFADWTLVEVTERDPGKTRNAGVANSNGRFVAFLDADDLFSENWLTVAASLLNEAEARGEKIIVHPELNWFFDGGKSILCKLPQDDPLFTPEYFYFSNYYDTIAVTPRQAHLDFPYAARDIAGGFAREDWQANIETMAAGWRHVSAPDTIIFKRRRDNSLVTESNATRAVPRRLDAMAIDRVRDLGRKA